MVLEYLKEMVLLKILSFESYVVLRNSGLEQLLIK